MTSISISRQLFYWDLKMFPTLSCRQYREQANGVGQNAECIKQQKNSIVQFKYMLPEPEIYPYFWIKK
jgi:hypothetical protein